MKKALVLGGGGLLEHRKDLKTKIFGEVVDIKESHDF